MVPGLCRLSREQDHITRQDQPSSRSPPRTVQQRVQQTVSHLLMVPSLRLYFSHPAVIPSFSLSLLYLTVLSFSGQMLTYLLASNINLWQVGIIRGISTVFELTATWIAPRLMRRIGVIRTGMWSISWQMVWLAAAISWFFYYWKHGYPSNSLLPAVGLAAAVSFSRVGLWGYDLSVQNIVQDVSSKSVERTSKGSSGVNAFQGGPSRPSWSFLYC
jgi:solute carrier family 40 (iron-regulated transporter), member 1